MGVSYDLLLHYLNRQAKTTGKGILEKIDVYNRKKL